MRNMETMKATTHNDHRCFNRHSHVTIDVFIFNACIFIPFVGIVFVVCAYLETLYRIDSNIVSFLNVAFALYLLFSCISLFLVGAQRAALFLRTFYALNKIHFLEAMEILENPNIRIRNRANECKGMRRLSRLSLRVLGARPDENTEPIGRSSDAISGREGSYVPSLPSEQR